MGDLDVPKKIDANSDMKICQNQNLKGSYIARYKNAVQDLSSSSKALDMKDITQRNKIKENTQILWSQLNDGSCVFVNRQKVLEKSSHANRNMNMF